jgi:4,5-DOPA dioxygenase extradiol
MSIMNTSPRTAKAPMLYIPHGGGPLPLLGEPGHREMVEFLTALPRTIQTPSAIVVVSAHWEAPIATVTSGAAPSLIYDYDGFPDESYEITYPAPGNPGLAREISRLLGEQEIPSRLDDQRGFDHGLFVPLKIMYPDASIPCVQVSLLRGLDPGAHLRLGRSLAALRTQNIMILGSGFSFHQLRAFFARQSDREDPGNDAFQDWLVDTCTNPKHSREERDQRLLDWETAPSARYCHPREEHLIPLHVCTGASETPAAVIFDGKVLGKRALAFLWND